MASEDTGNREQGSHTIDANDFHEMIRTGASDPTDLVKILEEQDEPKKEEVSREREPEIRAEEPSRTTKESEREQSPDLQRALETISRLEGQVSELSRSRFEPSRPEPDIEMVDVFPGVKLPKDKSRWPIQLTKEMVESVGIDPSIAPGLNTLANAFFISVASSVSESAVNAFEARQNAKREVESRSTVFENSFSDLKGNGDLVYAVENAMRREGLHQRGLSDAQYAAELATRARVRIAALRGISLEDYMSELKAGSGNVRTMQERQPTRSRASLSAGARSPRSSKVSESDRELNDMLG